MASNELIAEKMNELMYYYRRRSNSEKAAAFSVASTKIRSMDKPVAGMQLNQLRKFTDFEDFVIQKIREYIETGKISEFEKR